ncbi:aminotransferase class IV [Saccharopolyspora sp. ASAGF58]|uniref:aminotransferase class IV n=1 Tax=Saccharopolyspora sp. ASAGF58 TaxID=2719023 RepID=UPI001FF0D169|nr:aminotransferase class IV [Saccharopolyspora sp. ASAGF58]
MRSPRSVVRSVVQGCRWILSNNPERTARARPEAAPMSECAESGQGITQDSVAALAADLGVTVRRVNLLRSDLYAADEMFLCGTAAEVTPVRSVDNREIGEPGPVTRKIQDAFTAAVTGADERYRHWLTHVG